VTNIRSRSWLVKLLLLVVLSGIAWLPITAYVYRFYSLRDIGRVHSSPPTLRLESEHLILQSPEGYIKESDLNGLLARSEETLSGLKTFLRPPAPDKEKK
jgi:hypothetical protein